MPVYLRNVEYGYVKDYIWLRTLIPEEATEITVFFTRGGPVHSRFRLSAKEFAKWMESEGCTAPDYEGTLVVKEYIVMGDDDKNLPHDTVIQNAQAWDRDWSGSDWKRLVIYEPDAQIVRLSTYEPSRSGKLILPAVELLPNPLPPVPTGSSPRGASAGGAPAKDAGGIGEHIP